MVAVLHGDSSCKARSQLCSATPGGVLDAMPSSPGLQKPTAYSGFPVTVLLYLFVYQESYKHHFSTNTQSLQGN